MEEMNTLPEKKLSEVKNPITKRSSTSAPFIETPVPPQVMDPSTHPAIEWENPPVTRKRKVRARYQA